MEHASVVTAVNGRQDSAIELDALHNAQMVYTKRIENERSRLQQMEKRMGRMRSTLSEFQRTVGGEYLRRERQINSQRQSWRLEGQLQTVKEKHDRLQHKIKSLAADIDDERREKLHFARVRSKMEVRLAKRRQALNRLSKELQEKEDEREQAARQCDQLKSEILEEMDQFNEKTSLTHDSIVRGSTMSNNGLATFGSVLGRSGALFRQQQRQKVTRTTGSVGSPTATGVSGSFLTEQRSTVSADVDLPSEVNKAYWVVAKTRMDLTKQIERKEELYEAFDKICSETGVIIKDESLHNNSEDDDTTKEDASSSKNSMQHPLEQLVPLLLKSEEENYVIFRSINDLNQELECLELEKVDLERDMAARQEAQRKRAVTEEKIKADLGSKLETSTSTEQMHERAHRSNDLALMKAADSIVALFQKLGCDDLPNGEALLAMGLNERNVEQFLGFIEDQIVEVLQLDTHLNCTRDITGADDPTRPLTPKFNRDGKRLPALLLPDLQQQGNIVEATFSATSDDNTDDGHDDGLAAPVDPAKLMQALKARASTRDVSQRAPTTRNNNNKLAAVVAA